MKTFEVDFKKMNDAIEKCEECNKCYVEQIWRDIGDRSSGHCSATRAAFYKAVHDTESVHKVVADDLPGKDSYVCIKSKDGKHICAKLFYDEEEKPCMFCDDFDNWYSINDIESWKNIYMDGIEKLTIKVKE